jgi:protein arginine phosphatase
VAPRLVVLVVCHANTARSVMAEALLRRLLAERDLSEHVRVDSAGVADWVRDGMLPSLDARLVLREVGIELPAEMASRDLRRHRGLLAEAGLVLTMSRLQHQRVTELVEAAGKPIFTLREFAGEEGDIADPAAQGEDVFRACRDEIHRCLERSLDRLTGYLPPAR